jgi:RNA recognition motif-containing protein
MKLWIGNLAPGTTDDEIKAFVKKYGPGLECTDIQRVEGDGSRPAAIVDFTGTGKALGDLGLRLDGMYWKGRALSCSVTIAR